VRQPVGKAGTAQGESWTLAKAERSGDVLGCAAGPRVEVWGGRPKDLWANAHLHLLTVTLGRTQSFAQGHHHSPVGMIFCCVNTLALPFSTGVSARPPSC
jgi:hypothetical protein